MKLAVSLIVLALCFHSSQGQAYLATPLIGFFQGIVLQIAPAASTNQQCLVYGVPTPSGYAPRASTPLFVYTPKNSGSHILQFAYDSSSLVLSPFLAPGNSILQIDTSNQTNPQISFDATNSPQGASGAITVYLSNKTTNAVLCYSQIQFTVDIPLSCAPSYGGLYSPSSGSGASSTPSSAGTFVIPSGTIYAPTYVTNIIVQQFVTVNNVNINTVVVNVNNISNTTIINNIVAVPPTAPPVNCTATPSNPACAKTPTAVIVAPSPGKTTPTIAPPIAQPPARPPTVVVPPTAANPPQTAASPPQTAVLPPPTAVLPPQFAASPPTGAPASG